MISRSALRSGKVFGVLPRYYCEGANPKQGSPQSSKAANLNIDVPGLSSSVIAPATEPVGPGVDPKKSGAYKAPEYYCYNNMSFFEAEIEMQKFRLPQPSAERQN